MQPALACIIEAPLAGAHNFMLRDAEGNGASIEATPTRHHIERLGSETLVHTNHCIAPDTLAVEAERPEFLSRSSAARFEHATELLEEMPHTIERLRAFPHHHRSPERGQNRLCAPEDRAAVFELNLTAGEQTIEARLLDTSGADLAGAYFAYLRQN